MVLHPIQHTDSKRHFFCFMSMMTFIFILVSTSISIEGVDVKKDEKVACSIWQIENKISYPTQKAWIRKYTIFMSTGSIIYKTRAGSEQNSTGIPTLEFLCHSN